MNSLPRKRIVSKSITVTTSAPKRGPVKRGSLGKKIELPPTVISEKAYVRQEGEELSTSYQAVIQRYNDRIKNPKTAIRAKCVECSGGSLKEVAECRVVQCALYPFRMGENPFHKKTMDRLAREEGDDDNESTENDE